MMIVMVFFATGESEDGQRLRFQVELEFVQCLANPNYLLCEYFLFFQTSISVTVVSLVVWNLFSPLLLLKIPLMHCFSLLP